MPSFFLCATKFVFSYSAERTNPIFGQVGKCGSWGDAIIGIAYSGIVFVPANVTNILFHNVSINR